MEKLTVIQMQTRQFKTPEKQSQANMTSSIDHNISLATVPNNMEIWNLPPPPKKIQHSYFEETYELQKDN